MYEFTKEELEQVYSIVSDKGLKWKIGAVIDLNLGMDIIYKDPAWHWFVMDHIWEIRDILWYGKKDNDKNTNNPLIVDSWPISDYSYHWHYLDIEFKKLIKKCNETWNKEYARIRLNEDSGMTELKDKKSLRWIWERLEDMWMSDEKIKDIVRGLYKLWLYNYNQWDEDEKNWRVSLSINSNRELCLLLFNGEIEVKWYWWHYFIITDSYKKIIDIIIQKWYYENNIWEAIDFIIENNDKRHDEEDDEYDMV